MPLGVFNLPWYDHNSQRAYPLLNDSTGLDKTGEFLLPTDVLVGLWLPIYADSGLDAAGFYIRTIAFDQSEIKFVIAFESQAVTFDIATFRASRIGHTRNKPYRVYGLDQYSSVVGTAVIGRFDSVLHQPAGIWEFDPDASRLDPDAILFMPYCVESLAVVNSGGTSVRLTGPIELVLGSNLQGVPILDNGSPQIRLNAVSAVGFADPCVCDGGYTDAPCIRTINGLASVNGNVDILGSGCSKVTPVTNGLQLESNCCQPCCGCPELETITATLQQFESERQIWLSYVQSLGVQVQSFSLNVLGAKLGDKGCVSCS
jgi:hypothetical protein